MSKNTFTKVWLITVIALVTLFTSVSIVAHWPIMVNPPEGGSRGTTINIGSGGEINTLLSELNRIGDNSKELIPNHSRLTPRPHQTKEIVYEFDVIWTEDVKEGEKKASEGSEYVGELTLSSAVEYIDVPDHLSDDNKEAIKLLKVTFYVVEYINGQRKETLVTSPFEVEYEKQFTIMAIVTLEMPNDMVEYLGVKGNEFKITVTLSLDKLAEVIE